MGKLIQCLTCGKEYAASADSCIHCGEKNRGVENKEVAIKKIKNQYIEENKKSYAISFILCLLFGSLGLLYSNILAALFMTIILIILFIFIGFGFLFDIAGGAGLFSIFTVPGALFGWFICFVLGFFLVSSHNEKILRNADVYAGEEYERKLLGDNNKDKKRDDYATENQNMSKVMKDNKDKKKDDYAIENQNISKVMKDYYDKLGKSQD